MTPDGWCIAARARLKSPYSSLPGHTRRPAPQRPDAALLKGAEMTGLPIALTVAALLLIAWNWLSEMAP